MKTDLNTYLIEGFIYINEEEFEGPKVCLKASSIQRARKEYKVVCNGRFGLCRIGTLTIQVL